ncbi:cytochrome c oxidase polypeptide IV [Lineolata rhizophorae]|uniref:Cytochrome c oxidase subunit 4, mitochondrial n=1 Tax=Lineolata rhizophorae TaxID=578093 RepID=A0A6A6P3A9_9PEZI|nr:cytochrome c oxidase polypeptide IV [Lineolata rhizophorae]
MFVTRPALTAARRAALSARARPVAARSFATSFARREKTKDDPSPGEPSKTMKSFEEIKTEEDLLPPGAAPGTVPTDLEQATGLERLEILGKMQGIDVFDMKPFDTSRKGTMEEPVIIKSAGLEQYIGCTGFPSGSHHVRWLTLMRDDPFGRCDECGGVFKMEYVGDPHEHRHGPPEHKTWNAFADYLKPEYKDH